MIAALIVGLFYIVSIIMCAAIFIERCVVPSPISIFIVLCPIINTIYCIYRIPSLSCHWESWFENL